ncbi:hypothetical protein DRP04_00325 [Archaeoglobales archaeon]|jgi:cell division control protein 6|nr:MAG: hypothetical protein DRP04_00325 [Archaeoglobales archaeon]
MGQRREVDLATFFEDKSDIFKIPRVYKNRDALSGNFIPDELPHREEELRKIAQYLSYAIAGNTPPNLLILGSTGTGKTVTVKKVIKELKNYAGGMVETLYTVVGRTQQQTLIFLGQQMGVRLPARRGFDENWRKFKNSIDGDKKVIVVLDEIDKILPSCDLLYYLTRQQNICLVGISNKIGVMEMIKDKRVISSFNPIKIVFKRYNSSQLADILRYRASMAFCNGVLDDGVINYVASLAAKSGGDARYALDLLAFSGDIAISEGRSKITVDIVRKAMNEVEIEYIRKSISDLTDPQKILLAIVVASNENLSPSAVYNICKKVMLSYCGRDLTSWRLSEYMSELDLLGFVRIIKKGRGKGKGFSWYVQLDMSRDVILDIIREELNKMDIDFEHVVKLVKLAKGG